MKYDVPLFPFIKASKKKLLVLGATGDTGKPIVRQALELGHSVTAVVRNSAKISLEHQNLCIVTGDIFNFKILPLDPTTCWSPILNKNNSDFRKYLVVCIIYEEEHLWSYKTDVPSLCSYKLNSNEIWPCWYLNVFWNLSIQNLAPCSAKMIF